MAIEAGTRLGPYQIVSLIGAGGMGEVYRANDSRLGREVAVKVLPAQFSTDTDRLRRFEQEARAAGMLNHPNILTIYDIGTEDGTVFVVSELLTGETLRERMGGSPLPVRKAVEYALQIANGLSAAHEKGIVHRDLKPENIFLTRDGRAKILDFGLAKLTDREFAVEAQSKLQTVEPLTKDGIVLGTVGYMSPEQVRGRTADHRSDIFAFGAILYEMLTGKRAFQRDSAADTMSAILKEDPPDLSTINLNIPPSLERVVRHCLEKNAEERFQSARDLAFDLQMVSDASATSPVRPIEPITSKKTVRNIAAAALILLALVAAFFAGRRSPHAVTATQTQSAQLTDNPFKRLSFRRGYISAARFTPDGQSVVYSAAWVGSPQEIFVTRPQNPVSRSLGITNAVLLSVSNSGEMAILLEPRFLGGWQRLGILSRAPIDGGAPREILKDVQDADWSPDGSKLAVAHRVKAQYQLEYPIGKSLYASPGWFDNLRISPDGKLIAFMEHPAGGDDRGSVNVIDLQGKVKKLTEDFSSESGLHWSPDGKEIWFTASTTGSNEQPIFATDLQGHRRLVAAMAGNLILHDIDPKGVVLLTRDTRRREIVALPPGETRERDLSWFDWSYSRDLSADGKIMVFEEEGAGGGPNYSAFIRNTDGSPAVKLGEGYASSLSPDHNYIVSILPGDYSHITLLPTGAGETRVIQSRGITFLTPQPQWFADGKRILVAAQENGKRGHWWIYDLAKKNMTPVTPEGPVGPALITPDQNAVLARSPEGDFTFYSLKGEAIQKAAGLEPYEVPLRWATDGKTVYVVDGRAIPVIISRMNLYNGQRTLWKQITPSDPAGIAGQISVVMSADGESYAYTYRRVLSDLYLVPGLR
jgi:serine/threonine protein kinase